MLFALLEHYGVISYKAKNLLQFSGAFCSSGKPQQVSVLLNLFNSFPCISQMLLCFLPMQKEYHR